MILEIDARVLREIHAHGEKAYPEEGAGLLLGSANGDRKRVTAIAELANIREDSARYNRYLISPQEYLREEERAAQRGLDVLGVFHSHPDHPNRPSEFDREWAWPWFSYVITRVASGKAQGSRSWRLDDGREAFVEEEIQVTGE
ncbi:MAG TPA: M67 family metallopeptidase [Anaerolineales bacterium]|nr:M67 family metallopeptidase [Anaerolineales bacterium]